MLKLNGRATPRLLVGALVALILGVAPQLAMASSAPGSLTQLAGTNACIQATTVGGGECPNSTAEGLSGTNDVAVSPDGKNVYVISFNDAAIAEFSRNPADGSLSPIGCIADSAAPDSTCTHATGTGLTNPEAIAISPDGNNVYVAATDGNGLGAIAELVRNSGGTLSPISTHACIAEHGSGTPCPDSANGIEEPVDVAISPDGSTLYAVDTTGHDVAWFARGTGGVLSQSGGPDECIQDAAFPSSNECSSTAPGIADPSGVVISPDGDNVYTTGSNGDNGSIAEFTRNADGSLAQLSAPNDCIQTPSSNLGCGSTAIGLAADPGLVVSPDGRNVYVASQVLVGPIAEFSRAAGGALTQLPAPDDCFQEGVDVGCGRTGIGIASGFQLAISPDGASLYAAAPSSACDSANGCADVAEFARNADGTLTQLASPDSCIQDQGAEGSECPGNENGLGLGGPGIAISPGGDSVYVTGLDDIAAFARTPVTHTLTVSLSGTGAGRVSDGGALDCQSSCSNAYTANTPISLTASPSAGSTFAGWSGACSGTGSCQITMSADMSVTATFTATTGPPAPVLTSAPSAVTDAEAAFAGSVNPEGLATSVYFQYGLDKRYSAPGESGANYTRQTPAQSVGSDFSDHAVGPVSVSGLLPNALYHVRIVATNSAGTVFGQDVTFTTATSPAPSAPTIGQTFNIQPISGLVFVYIHGQLVPLTDVEQIGPGITIDSRHGTFELTTAGGAGGTAHDAAAKGKRAKTQTGQFGGAVVRIRQTTHGANRGLTTVMMVESAFKGAPGQAICGGQSADGHGAALSSKTIQLLHAKAHGKFSTSGRYSAATVRGTSWTMTARCDGTLTHVISDSVVVTDLVRHKTIILHAGQSYLAPGRRRR